MNEQSTVKYHWYTIMGRCMEPELTEGDEVLVEVMSADLVRPGEIAAFSRGGSILTHRIVRKHYSGPGLVLEEKPDTEIRANMLRPEDIIGRVIAIKRSGKVVMMTTEQDTIKNISVNTMVFTSAALAGISRLRTRLDSAAYRLIVKVFKRPFYCLLGICNRISVCLLSTRTTETSEKR